MQCDPGDPNAPVILNCAQPPLSSQLDVGSGGNANADANATANTNMIVEWHVDGTVCYLMADGTMVQKNGGQRAGAGAANAVFVTMSASMSAKANSGLDGSSSNGSSSMNGGDGGARKKQKLIFSPNGAATVVIDTPSNNQKQDVDLYWVHWYTHVRFGTNQILLL